MPIVTLPAFAKINRDLRIVGRDDEGYHVISTVFETLALHDTISLDAVDGPLRVTCSDPTLPTDDGNLVTRMVRAWCRRHRAGVTDGIHVDIEKRIPMQAGLGGGSADAAATLVALTMHARRLVHASEARDALSAADRAMAASLGADVAFFLVGGRALGTGRGEQVRPLDEAPMRPVVVAQPGFGVPTAEAYRWFAEAAGLRPGQSWRRSDDPGRPGVVGCTNDLQAGVAARFPAIGRLVAALRGSGARQAAMTGSGSAVFGVFESDRAAARAVAAVAALGARTWLTTTLPRAACWHPAEHMTPGVISWPGRKTPGVVFTGDGPLRRAGDVGCGSATAARLLGASDCPAGPSSSILRVCARTGSARHRAPFLHVARLRRSQHGLGVVGVGGRGAAPAVLAFGDNAVDAHVVRWGVAKW